MGTATPERPSLCRALAPAATAGVYGGEDTLASPNERFEARELPN